MNSMNVFLALFLSLLCFHYVNSFQNEPTPSSSTPIVIETVQNANHDVEEPSVSVPHQVHSVVPSTPRKKFGYVTLHYEGTKRDQEYLLGIRTLIRGLQLSGTEHDILVIVPESVSESSKNILKESGAKLIEVEGIKNPYKENKDRRISFQDRFSQTLNKLHIWNQTQYDRLVYMDADNMILGNMDELFNCGHFCAVFMNVAVFHTGLMVVKPDSSVFNDMINKLETEDSYDGADQGFLVSYFSGFLSAPLFVGPQKTQSQDRMNRLPVNYNINHMYFYEKASWNFYRRFHFAGKRIPALSIAYPIAPGFKPWYWWSYLFLTVNYEWFAVREQITEKFYPARWIPYVIMMIVAVLFDIGISGYSLLSIWKKYRMDRLTKYVWVKWFLVLCWFLITLFLTLNTIPPMVYPSTGLWTFLITQNYLFYSLFFKVYNIPRTQRIKVLVYSITVHRVFAYLCGVNFELVGRILSWLLGLEGFPLSEFVFLYYQCFKYDKHHNNSNVTLNGIYNSSKELDEAETQLITQKSQKINLTTALHKSLSSGELLNFSSSTETDAKTLAV